jgi:DNA mismatch repair protein MutL
VTPSAARTEHDPLFRPTIFQVHNKYLISQIRSGIAIIDQHAAHERILYERALKSFRERMFNAQQLLFPLLLELEPEEDAVFQEIRQDLEPLGFQVRDFGPRTYSIEAVPAGLKRASESDMIRSMLDEYKEFRQANFNARDAVAASFACKAAIRTGDELTPDERTALIDELFATEFPLTCPHGRPTVIHLRMTELDRRFKRIE